MDRSLGDAAVALADAARSMNEPESLEETLQAIVQAAQQSLPGFNHVGVSVTRSRGGIETMAATDKFVWDLDALQYELDEGPCVSAMRDGPVVVVEHAATDKRWPNYLPRAVKAGLRSQLGLRLYSGRETWGGLNLYSTEADTVDGEAFQIAELFATHAALALGRAQHVHQLSEAVASRQIIGEAIGILIERYQLDHERAFQFLVRASSTSNIKVRDLAQRLVDDAIVEHSPGAKGRAGR